MSNIVCFRNYMIVLDSVVVVNLLVFMYGYQILIQPILQNIHLYFHYL